MEILHQYIPNPSHYCTLRIPCGPGNPSMVCLGFGVWALELYLWFMGILVGMRLNKLPDSGGGFRMQSPKGSM